MTQKIAREMTVFAVALLAGCNAQVAEIKPSTEAPQMRPEEQKVFQQVTGMKDPKAMQQQMQQQQQSAAPASTPTP